MFNFFGGLYRKLKNSIYRDQYKKAYGDIIYRLRKTTPLTLQDIENIQNAMYTLHGERDYVRRKFRQLKNAIEYRQKVGDTKMIKNDVSYVVNGELTRGEVDSAEEEMYFTKRNTENKTGCIEPKHDKSKCIKCLEKQIRVELQRKMELENRAQQENKVKRMKKAKARNINRFTTLNEKLGLPTIIGKAVGDEYFDMDDLDSDEKLAYEEWNKNKNKTRVEEPKKEEITNPFGEIKASESFGADLSRNAAFGNTNSKVTEHKEPKLLDKDKGASSSFNGFTKTTKPTMLGELGSSNNTLTSNDFGGTNNPFSLTSGSFGKADKSTTKSTTGGFNNKNPFGNPMLADENNSIQTTVSEKPKESNTNTTEKSELKNNPFGNQQSSATTSNKFTLVDDEKKSETEPNKTESIFNNKTVESGTDKNGIFGFMKSDNKSTSNTPGFGAATTNPFNSTTTNPFNSTSNELPEKSTSLFDTTDKNTFGFSSQPTKRKVTEINPPTNFSNQNPFQQSETATNKTPQSSQNALVNNPFDINNMQPAPENAPSSFIGFGENNPFMNPKDTDDTSNASFTGRKRARRRK
ncbi:hypothetical protein ECANGB1_29 [Enterospora canceri]|uniref:Uncharacterized protein n=1 Tax=Enterospora canceri TaxID=1081671 RepID=A0A1Y1S9J5_9MICR|nr:hypothetical protein ECANGB1_29 [Enterospora canceri]